MNKYAPFASEIDWRVAQWAVVDGVGHNSLDHLLAIPGVVKKLGISFHNTRAMHQTMDSIPAQAKWKTQYLSFPDAPDDKHLIQYCDPLEAIKTLLGNPAHTDHTVYKPYKIFSDHSKTNHIYNEMWTGKWWHSVQEKGAMLAPVIITTDKTQLTQFSGSKSAYPVYLTLGNISKAIHRKPSEQACVLIGYLSVDKILASHLTQKEKSSRIQRLFHDSMRIILEPLKEAGMMGMEVTGGDGKVRKVHPVLACYVVDYPEQCLVTCTKLPERHTQTWTLGIIKEAKASSPSLHQFHSKCQASDLSGTVQHPFWEGYPYTNIHLAIVPDVLHQLTLPPCYGIHRFQNGWSALSQISGKERKDMACILLAYTLDTFHKHKDILIRLDIREHLNIPKIHSMVHYVESICYFGCTDNYNTEAFECLHIDLAKDAWRATNKRDERPQMVAWLTRQEKIAQFHQYLKRQEREGQEHDLQHSPQTISLTKYPSRQGQTLQDIMLTHRCPVFLNKCQSKRAGATLLSRRTVELSNVPFNKLDVFHAFKFACEELGNDAIDMKQEKDWV
ncbi:hypothetical protein DFH29DRAFT_982183 [Suillus ampliporus]|nr:hypothetical protein DFH29DRAFT_982183 [Suillus ampliporus]